MVEIKGGAIVLKAKKFIITSNINPELWYPNSTELQREALQRRITRTEHLLTPYTSPTLPPTLPDRAHRQHPTLQLDSEDTDFEYFINNY